MTSRSLIQRACAVFGLFALAACLFYIGKGHTLLLDTNAVTINGKELRSWASVTVVVDGEDLDSSMGRAERVMVDVSGPKHTIVIADDADTDKKMEKTFRIPTFMKTVVVSIPAILGGAPEEHWVAPFTPPPLEDMPVEKMQYSQ
jgi:hypothetical protein